MSKIVTSFRIEEELFSKLKKRAKEQDRSFGYLLNKFIVYCLKNNI